MRDYQVELQTARDEGDQGAFVAGEGEWQRNARLFWVRSQGMTNEAIPEVKRKYRQKAKAWAIALDKQLQVMCNVGLSRFQVAPDLKDRPPAETWPVLSLALDQGSDGWSGSMYLMRKGFLNILLQWDPSHRCWNDAQAGLRHAKLWGSTLLLQLTMNLDHGPWRDGRWHAEVVQAAELYSKFQNPENCALMQSLIQAILEDSGDTDMLADPWSRRSSQVASPGPSETCSRRRA